MNRVQRSIQNSIWGMTYRILHIVFPVLMRAVIIREIGAEYVGLDGLFKSILSVLNLSELGFGTAIVYMMYKPIAEDDKQTLRVLMTLLRKVYRWVGIAILTLGCCVIPFLDMLVKNDTGADVNLYLLYGMYLFHTAFSYLCFSYRSALFTAHQRSDINFKIMVVCSVIQYALQIIVLFSTRNYYLYLLIFTLMIIPQNISYWIASKKKYPDLYCEGKPTSEQVSIITAKIKTLLGHRLGNTVIFSTNSVIVSAVLGVTLLTKFDNYNYILSAVTTLMGVFLTSIAASVGNKLNRDSIDSTYILFKKLTFLWIGLIGLCSTCFASLYQPFIALWVGEEYLFSEGVAISFACYFFVWQFRLIGINVKDAAGLWEPDRWKPYIGMTLNLFLSILFVRLTNSVIGVLIPTMLVLLLVYFPWETSLLFKYVFRRSSKEYLMLVLRCILTAVVAISCTYLLVRLLPERGIVFLVVRGILCVTVMPLIYAALNRGTPQLREIIVLFRGLWMKHFWKK